MPHGSANWLRRSDTGISFCRGEEEGGVGAWGEKEEEREMKMGGLCVWWWWWWYRGWSEGGGGGGGSVGWG